MATLEELMIKERERLNKLVDDIATRRKALEDEEATVKRELLAITAYETAKQGKPKKTISATPSGSKRENILSMIENHKGGIARGELLDELGIKGNKSAEQSVSNALNSLKKANKITSKDGKYAVV